MSKSEDFKNRAKKKNRTARNRTKRPKKVKDLGAHSVRDLTKKEVIDLRRQGYVCHCISKGKYKVFKDSGNGVKRSLR